MFILIFLAPSGVLILPWQMAHRMDEWMDGGRNRSVSLRTFFLPLKEQLKETDKKKKKKEEEGQEEDKEGEGALTSFLESQQLQFGISPKRRH